MHNIESIFSHIAGHKNNIARLLSRWTTNAKPFEKLVSLFPNYIWIDTHLWILQKEVRGCCRTLLDELITTNILGYRNLTRMEPAFCYLIEERITPHLRKSITNFRKPSGVSH